MATKIKDLEILLLPAADPTHSEFDLADYVEALGGSLAAHVELVWFFGDALAEIELQSNWYESLQRSHHRVRDRNNREVDPGERRVEALHAARTIYDRLKRLAAPDLALLRSLYEADEPALTQALVEESGAAVSRALRAYEATRAGFRRSVVPAREEV